MSNAPNPNNYSLGRGKLFFDKKMPDGSYEGERDLGNCPNFTVNIATEKLDHFNSRSGLKSKDKTVVLQITPAGAITLDEPNGDNLALTFMTDPTSVTQTAVGNNLQSLVKALANAGVAGNRYHEIGSRSIGCLRVPYDNLAGGVPSPGDSIYVGASGTKDNQVIAVTQITSTTGILYVVNTDANDEALVDGDVITDGIWSADCDFSALTGTVAAFDTTNILVYDTDTPTTIYTLNDDYKIDSSTGRIYIVEGGAIDTADANITIRYHRAAVTYQTLNMFEETQIEGKLRFVSDNPVGANKELVIWRADLAPSGDLSWIGDDWQMMEFTYEILKDETNHPTEPYGKVIIL